MKLCVCVCTFCMIYNIKRLLCSLLIRWFLCENWRLKESSFIFYLIHYWKETLILFTHFHFTAVFLAHRIISILDFYFIFISTNWMERKERKKMKIHAIYEAGKFKQIFIFLHSFRYVSPFSSFIYRVLRSYSKTFMYKTLCVSDFFSITI